MLNKLLFKHQDKRQLIIATIGAFLGITFLITSIHYLIKVQEFGEGSDILGPNTIIVQKQVTTSTTLGVATSDFSEKEIENLKSMDFILDVQPVVSNNFNLWFETADERIPSFKTNLFIQTLDKNFLDTYTKDWHWKEGDPYVPIIMPRDFIVMMNTYASAAGFTQVSDDIVKSAKFKFMLSNNSGKKKWVDVKIIGFTSSVSAVLVPESFMTYGNTEYTIGEKQKVTQLMISGKESEFGKVENLLEQRGLETKNSEMIVGRLKSIVGTLVLVILTISVVAVFVSGLVLIQYMQLLMAKNAYEVRTLMRIGYHPKDITRKFAWYFFKVFGMIALSAVIAFYVLKLVLDEQLIKGGLYIDQSMTFWTFASLLFAYALFSLASFISAKRGVMNEF